MGFLICWLLEIYWITSNAKVPTRAQPNMPNNVPEHVDAEGRESVVLHPLLGLLLTIMLRVFDVGQEQDLTMGAVCVLGEGVKHT